MVAGNVPPELALFSCPRTDQTITKSTEEALSTFAESARKKGAKTDPATSGRVRGVRRPDLQRDPPDVAAILWPTP
jgi:hypothetical protein